MAQELLKLELVNYKGLPDMSVDISNYDVVVVEGDNRKGKSSIINGLLENFQAKALSDNPTKQGEKEGEKRVEILVNGKKYVIIHDFSSNKGSGSFYALEGKRQIRSVNEIREILGEVNNLTIEELFSKAKTVPGRREIIRNYFLNDLSQKDKDRLEEIERKIAPRTGDLFIERTAQNKLIEKLKQDIDRAPSDKDIEMVEKLNSGSYQNSLDYLEQIFRIKEYYDEFIDSVKTFHDKYQSIKGNLKEKFSKSWSEVGLSENVEKAIAEIINIETNTEEISERIDKGKEIIATAKAIKSNVDNYNKAKQDYDKELKELDNINEQLENLAKEKETIMKGAKLPKGVKILSESEFTVNGFDFSAADISESEAWMILAEIIIKRFNSPYMRMGNASIYNKENLNNLAKIAADNNKVIALERVIDNLDNIRMVGYVADNTEGIELDIETISPEANSSNTSNEIQKDEVDTTEEKEPVKTPINDNKDIDTENDIRNIEIDF